MSDETTPKCNCRVSECIGEFTPDPSNLYAVQGAKFGGLPGREREWVELETDSGHVIIVFKPAMQHEGHGRELHDDEWKWHVALNNPDGSIVRVYCGPFADGWAEAIERMFGAALDEKLGLKLDGRRI